MKTEIVAPMPGMIIEIRVNVGDAVREFPTVAVLEAMEMENQVASTTNGKVCDIKVTAGEPVKADQVLTV